MIFPLCISPLLPGSTNVLFIFRGNSFFSLSQFSREGVFSIDNSTSFFSQHACQASDASIDTQQKLFILIISVGVHLHDSLEQLSNSLSCTQTRNWIQCKKRSDVVFYM